MTPNGSKLFEGDQRAAHSASMARNARIVARVTRTLVALPVLALILLLLRCEANPAASKQAAVDTAAILTAQEQIKLQLRDPSSAVFSATRRTTHAVCGLVNAANAFGGMTGPRRFIVDSAARIEPAEIAESFDAAWSREC